MPYGTIELPRAMIDAAEEYAEREHRTVVDLFADLMNSRYGFSLKAAISRAHKRKSKMEVSPIVKSLRGILSAPLGKSDSDIITDALLEKYEALR